MKLKDAENFKLQYVNNIQTTTSHLNNIHESDTELAEKITQLLNIYEKNPNFEGKPSFKKWCNYCRRYGHSIAECKKNSQIIRINHKKHRELNKSFYQCLKKDQNLLNKTFTVTTVQENHFLITIMPLDNNHPTYITIMEDLQTKKFTKFLTKLISSIKQSKQSISK